MEGVGDEEEVGLGDGEVAEAETGTPVLFVGDEGEVGEQVVDGCGLAGEVVDVVTVGLEAAGKGDLIGGVGEDLADGGEGLQEVAVGVVGARGVVDEPVALVHAGEGGAFAVV